MAPAGYGHRVEGLHAVTAAARAGRILRLLVERGRRDRPQIRSIIDAVGEERVSLVEDLRELAETDSPQGVLAECSPIQPFSLKRMVEDSNAVLVLDHVEDPHNLGAIARSAAAAGLGGLVVSTRRASPLSAVAFKSASGALESLPVALVASIPEALLHLKRSGFWVVGLEASADQSLFGLDLLTEPVALVIGGEGTGLARLSSERCDLLVSIPMAEGAESLNASVSAALAAFEIMRMRGTRY